MTGAGGFIGLALCHRLAAAGRRVAGVDLDARARGRVEAVAEFRHADVADPDAIATAVRGAAAVVHTAALVGDRVPMEAGLRVNTRGTRNVLDAAGDVPVVVLSSVAVWGYEFSSDVPEHSPPRPCGLTYVDTKGATETMTLLRGGTVIRPGDVYGPRSEPWVLRPLRALRAGTFRLPGRGEGVMTPVYVDDLVEAILLALDAPGGRAYTVWDGRPVAARDFFAFHARWAGRRRVPTAPRPLALAGAGALEALAGARARRPGRSRGERLADVSREALTYVSRRAAYPNARARLELGWEPRVTLEEGMRRTEEWLREERLLPAP